MLHLSKKRCSVIVIWPKLQKLVSLDSVPAAGSALVQTLISSRWGCENGFASRSCEGEGGWQFMRQALFVNLPLA